jgi:hypothetical protein
MGLNSVAQWFADHINRYAIPQLCRLNFGEDFTDFPELTFTDLRLVLQREVLAEAIAKLVQVGILTADRSLQDWMRDVFDLPPLPEEEPDKLNSQHLKRQAKEHGTRGKGQVTMDANFQIRLGSFKGLR